METKNPVSRISCVLKIKSDFVKGGAQAVTSEGQFALILANVPVNGSESSTSRNTRVNVRMFHATKSVLKYKLL